MTARAPRDLVDDAERRRQRRARLAATPQRYGLDFVDVVEADPGARWTLRLGFVPDLSGSSTGHGYPPTLRPEQVAISAGAEPGKRLPEIGSLRFSARESDTLTLEVTLRRPPPLDVLRGPLTVSLEHVPGVDPLFASAGFMLGAERDAGEDRGAEPAVLAAPGASYAVKDYAGFVGLMSDRLRLTLPGWEERSPADVGVMLVELLAYAADYLSYEQDAAATEAYLGTARKRRSLRRHARLLDYFVSEGRSSRVWLQVTVRRGEKGETLLLPKGWTFRTGSVAPPVAFESLHHTVLCKDHNAMRLYAWGVDPFVVPAQATSAVLDGAYPGLHAGDVLVFVSHGDPRDGGDPYQAHPVRLSEDPVLDHDPVLGRELTRIAWFTDDAIPFPLFAGDGDGAAWVHGNVILAEQHLTFSTSFSADDRELSPEPGVFVVPLPLPEGWDERALVVAGAAPYDDDSARAAPAKAATIQDPAQVQPCVRVWESRGGDVAEWACRHSFLLSTRFARDVAVDVDDPGGIRLTFGDGTLTRALSPGAKLEVQFGVGGGPAGNVGRGTVRVVDTRSRFPEDALAAIELPEDALAVTNFLPAVGGEEAEPAARIKARAPIAYLEQERCVAPADYVAAAKRIPGVRDAAAVLAWTGSFQAAVVHVLPEGSDVLEDGLRDRVTGDLFQRRLAGMDLSVRPPRYVPVAVGLHVRLAPGYEAGPVREALEAELGDGDLEDGRRGIFHRDAYGFGDALHLSPIVARAASVPGVESVHATRFHRWEDGPGEGEPASVIVLGETEVARVRGDVERPGSGLVDLTIEEAG